MISIHVPRTGDDDRRKAHCPRNQYFNPRPPHGGTTEEYDKAFDKAMISIHVPRTGDDKSRGVAFTDNLIISIHIPRTGDDVVSGMRTTSLLRFQSTYPARGTTRSRGFSHKCGCNFNPRPPCGGRPQKGFLDSSGVSISIHVPRTGDDHMPIGLPLSDYLFQSTSPARGTTKNIQESRLKMIFQSTSPAQGTT